MAVQAQYPSNVLLLNRNGQEGLTDYSLQQHGFLDQSHLLFNNGGGTNPRKRAREVNPIPMNPLISMQTQQSPHIIDMAQLHNPPLPNMVSTGLRLSLGDQQQLHNHQQQNQNQNQNGISHSSSSFLLSEDLATQIKHQRYEIDQFLQAQGEQLRRTLADKMQRHYRALLGTAEESVARRLREKESEIEKVGRRNAELEARAAQLSVEAQVWQAKARAQEATAANLQAKLQQAIMYRGVTTGAQDRRVMEDGLSLACSVGVEGGQADDAESVYIDPDRVVVSGPSCKACQKRVASVVVLPCRHFCLCEECDQLARVCPICHTIKNSSVEVYLS